MIDLNPLFIEIRELILNTRKTVSRGVDLLHVLTNYEIGHRIVNHEQDGMERAEYGKGVLIELSARLTSEFGRGFSRSNLEYMRKFYLIYRDRLPQKSQMVSGRLQMSEKSQMVSGKYEHLSFNQPAINQKDSWPFGQMQMYVNYFDRHVKLDHENPTVGIILCRKKHDALVEITLPEDANIHASKYQLYLPSKEELRQKLIAWTEEQERIKDV